MPEAVDVSVLHLQVGGGPILKAATSTNESPLEELVDDVSYYIRHYTPEVIQYLDASRWMNRLELGRRYDPNAPRMMEEELLYMESNRIGTQLTVLKECVGDGHVTYRSKLLCEGMLVRALVGSLNMEHVYGYCEAWVCVVSRMLHFRYWKRVWLLLSKLNDHMRAFRSGAIGRRSLWSNSPTRDQGQESGKKLFTVLCGAVVDARSHMKRGAYCLVDEDVSWKGVVDMKSGKNLTIPTNYGRGVLEGLKLVYQTEEVEGWFPFGDLEPLC
jgi:hypothetical protein